jgi:hypothetical protein
LSIFSSLGRKKQTCSEKYRALVVDRLGVIDDRNQAWDKNLAAHSRQPHDREQVADRWLDGLDLALGPWHARDGIEISDPGQRLAGSRSFGEPIADIFTPPPGSGTTADRDSWRCGPGGESKIAKGRVER